MRIKTKMIYGIGIALVLLTLFFSSTVEALEITVTVDPPTIYPGYSTTITVWCDSEGEGKITVKPPEDGGPAVSVDIALPPGGGTIEKTYPDDFPSGSTTALGEYKVHVVMHDRSAAKSFWVSANVIPENPLGSLGLMLTLFATLGIYTFTKRGTSQKS